MYNCKRDIVIIHWERASGNYVPNYSVLCVHGVNLIHLHVENSRRERSYVTHVNNKGVESIRWSEINYDASFVAS